MFTRLPKFARVILIIALLWLFIFFPYALDNFRSLVIHVYRLFFRSHYSLHILNTAQWRNFDPNRNLYLPDLAGFRRGDRFNWEGIDMWQHLCRKRGYWRNAVEWDEEEWVNVTGVMHGEWVQFGFLSDAKDKTIEQLSFWEISHGAVWPFWDPGDYMMNVTGNKGRVTLTFDEKASLEVEVEEEDTVESDDELHIVLKLGIGHDTALVRGVAATMTIQDESTGDNDFEMRVHGVHWPRIGALLMTTTSDKFARIFGLPHLSLGYDYFTTSQRLLNATIGKILGEAAWYEARNQWTASSGVTTTNAWRTAPHCEYVVYVQMHPRERTVDGELECPNGTTVLERPKWQMSTVIFSPDCGFILEPKEPPAFSPLHLPRLVCKDQEEEP